MNKGMVKCPECYRWFFDWKKRSLHLVEKHGYEIELPDEEATSNEMQKG